MEFCLNMKRMSDSGMYIICFIIAYWMHNILHIDPDLSDSSYEERIIGDLIGQILCMITIQCHNILTCTTVSMMVNWCTFQQRGLAYARQIWKRSRG